MDIKLEQIVEEDFDEVFRIMEESFPEDELRPYKEQKALLARDGYFVFGPKGEDGDIAGFITLWDFEGLIYADHFAVNPRYRNKGIGGAMLAALLAKTDDLVCLEVDPPETEMARRRMGFYERNGFHLCEWDYLAPPISEGKNPVPMKIMTSREVDEEGFGRIVGALKSRVYGQSV